MLEVLFPDGLDDAGSEIVRSVIAGDRPSPSSARRALGAVDQQQTPSPVTIRWGADDLDVIDVDGIGLTVDRADASVSIQIAAGSYEPHVAATLDRLLSPGDVFVDVGANVGYHTVRAVRSVGEAGRVFAVEANPENARLIARTVETNRLDNVTLLPLALADRWGHVEFGTHVGSNGGFLARAADGRGTVVPTAPLDDLDLGAVSVVKIDVEGAEALVIDGCRAMIERDRPSFVMEFSIEMTTRVSRRAPEAHLDRFVDWGYSVALVDRISGRPEPVASVDQLLSTWGSPVRIEDLLLVPESRPG